MTDVASLEHLGDAFALTAPTERKRMLVIVNPYATTVSDRLRNLVVYALQGRYEVEAIDTTAKAHAIQLAREAAGEGFDVVVAFGGDGTVNETANGLAGSGTPMTTLPGGATNVFARMLGLPNDIVDATEHLLRMADDFRPRAVDLARVGDRWFTFSAGMGLDAAVVEQVDAHPKLKARYGPVFYGASAVSTFSRRYVLSPPQLQVTVDGEALATGVSAFVQNGDPYTYSGTRPLHLAEHSRLTRAAWPARCSPEPARPTCRRSCSARCRSARRCRRPRRSRASTTRTRSSSPPRTAARSRSRSTVPHRGRHRGPLHGDPGSPHRRLLVS